MIPSTLYIDLITCVERTVQTIQLRIHQMCSALNYQRSVCDVQNERDIFEWTIFNVYFNLNDMQQRTMLTIPSTNNLDAMHQTLQYYVYAVNNPLIHVDFQVE